MKIKKHLAFVTTLLICHFAYAQKQNVYYLKNNGKPVSTKDSADYIRVIKEPDSGSVAYNLTEYYKTGKVKRIGRTLTIDKITLDGQCVVFFKNGKREMVATYQNGYLAGDMISFFPNGVLYTIKTYNPQTRDMDIKMSNDSTGKPMVVDGNGHYITYTDDLKQISTEGDLKNGVKNGEWKGYKMSYDSLNIVETYADGKLVRGTSTDKTGKTYSYEARDEVPPSYVGGEEGFATFLINNVRYPYQAKENNIQGRVFISFVVERDGSLTDIKITRSPHNLLGQEALRVIKLSPKWNPGIQYGRPVRVQYMVPINFSL